jgi:hypothetical protein
MDQWTILNSPLDRALSCIRREFISKTLCKIKCYSLFILDPWLGMQGYDKTNHRARKAFFWPGMKSDVKRFIRECDICQRVKA